jgi:hypothetical protein
VRIISVEALYKYPTPHKERSASANPAPPKFDLGIFAICLRVEEISAPIKKQIAAVAGKDFRVIKDVIDLVESDDDIEKKKRTKKVSLGVNF